MDEKTWRNHFVPQCYLKNFSGGQHGNSLSFLDLTLNNPKPIVKSPKSLGWQSKLYWSFLDDQDPEHYEKKFGQYEKGVGILFENLRKENYAIESITDIEIYYLGEFISIQLLRTPEVIKGILPAAEAYFVEISKKLMEIADSKEQVEEFVSRSNPKNEVLSSVFKLKEDFMKKLENCFFILGKTDEPMITSDQPVIMLDGDKLLDNTSFPPDFTDVIMPISRFKYFRFLRKDASNFLNLSVDDLNGLIIQSAHKEIFFNPEDSDYAVTKLREVKDLVGLRSFSKPLKEVAPYFFFRISNAETGEIIASNEIPKSSIED